MFLSHIHHSFLCYHSLIINVSLRSNLYHSLINVRSKKHNGYVRAAERQNGATFIA